MLKNKKRCSVSLILTGLLMGCGGTAPPATPNAAPPVTAAPPQSSAEPAPAAPSTGATVKADPSRKETKWIGNIPYDVFYDQPLNIATDTTMVAGAPTATVAAVAPGSGAPGVATSGIKPEMTTPVASPSGSESEAGTAAGAVNWEEVMPMPILTEEIKAIRTRLTSNLQTVATFNKSQTNTALDGSMLAALAVVAANHPGEATWKANAHFVRDLAFEINANSAGSGREPFSKTKEPFDKIMVILDGGMPPEMESPEKVPYAETVYVSDMMKRIEFSFNNLKANINTEARIKEDPAAAEREMRMLMLLATMMGDTSYDSADEPKYQEFIKRFTDGTRAGVAAIKTGNIDGFQAALNQVQTTCAECHQQYRGSDSGF